MKSILFTLILFSLSIAAIGKDWSIGLSAGPNFFNTYHGYHPVSGSMYSIETYYRFAPNWEIGFGNDYSYSKVKWEYTYNNIVSEDVEEYYIFSFTGRINRLFTFGKFRCYLGANIGFVPLEWYYQEYYMSALRLGLQGGLGYAFTRNWAINGELFNTWYPAGGISTAFLFGIRYSFL